MILKTAVESAVKVENAMHKEMCQLVVDNLFEGVYYVDRERRITYWSKGAERITGYRAEEVVGARCSENILRHVDEDGNELCISGCPLQATIDDSSMRDFTVFLHHKKGHRVRVRGRVLPMLDTLGQVVGAVEIFQDISKRSDLIRELERLKSETLHDDLTGIGNRRLAEMGLQEAMSYLARKKTTFGLIFLDIDHFKDINDEYGHAVGDRVLQMVAKTVSTLSRPFDTVARWGGEEFVVVVPGADMEVLRKVAERVRSFVEKGWLMAGDNCIRVTVSAGATLALEDEAGEEVVARADALMYKSKKAGRNRVTVG